ncbi:MAG: HNH endonuclease [Bacillota bacterium]
MKEYKKILKMHIFERDHGKCRFCQKELKPDKCTLDHYLPKSDGGPESSCNLVLSCKKCNRLKGGRTPEDYEKVIVELFKREVGDRWIRANKIEISYRQLQGMVEKLSSFKIVDDCSVFTGDGITIYVKNNRIVRILNN